MSYPRAMMSPRFWLLLLSPLLLLPGAMAHGQIRSVIPGDNEVLHQFQSPMFSHAPLAPRFKLMVWNALKAEHPNWTEEYLKLSAHQDVVLLQEAMLNSTFRDALSFSDSLGPKPKQFNFAASFLWEEAFTGVVSGSTSAPLRTRFFRSQYREPFTNTPKMTLSQDFPLNNSAEISIRILNMHALNFVSDAQYEDQLREALGDLNSHTGPVIFAGDLNVSNETRWEIVLALTESHGLRRVPTNSLPPHQNLDHIFVRGCNYSSNSETETPASDHPALFVEVDCSASLQSR